MRAINLIFPFLLLNVLISKAQIDSARLIGQNHCQQGANYLKIEKYKEADSVLTLALGNIKNEDVYFNRGVSRFYQNDTTGFCDDMYTAAYKYVDINAAKLFNEYCCYKVDSCFYDKKYNKLTTPKDFRYLEEIQLVKKSNITRGVIHQRNIKNYIYSLDALSGKKLPQINMLKTDIIAIYQLIDSSKYYTITTKEARFSDEAVYDDFKKKVSEYFGNKYKSIKNQDTTKKIMIHYKINISESGKVIDSKYIGIYPELVIPEKEKEIIDEIKDLVNIYPSLTPALFKDEKVNYIMDESIMF